MNPHFELTFSPTIELISVVRRFVSSFYERLMKDEDTTSRLALATHELLENACKYAIDGQATLRIELIKERSLVRICLANRTTSEHIADLRRRFREMDDLDDPAAYYEKLMRSTMKNTEGSGLGLARLSAEADMTMRLELDGDRVCIVADTHAPEAFPTLGSRVEPTAAPGAPS